MWAKTLTFGTYGGPEVLDITDVWVPEPGPGQVRVRIQTAGLNPVDGKIRSGDFSGGMPLIPPARGRLGSEFCGTVDAVGPGVEDYRPGDEVIGGSPERIAHTEAIVTVPSLLAPKPLSLRDEVACTFVVGGMTAMMSLRKIHLDQGDTLIVHGASGSVGTVAVQVAVKWGARVIGTASPQNHDWIRQLGGTPVSYGPGLEERLDAEIRPGDRVKVLDAAGREALETSMKYVADPAADIITLLPLLHEEFGCQFNFFEYDTTLLRELVELFSDGTLQHREPVVLPFEDVRKAHEILDTNTTTGRLVLRFNDRA